MLRKIISIYKAVFLTLSALVMLGVLGGGFYQMVEGITAMDRWGGVTTMVAGSILVLFFVGNFALIVEGNDLLRRIAEQTSKEPAQSRPAGIQLAEARAEPTVRRIEPTL